MPAGNEEQRRAVGRGARDLRRRGRAAGAGLRLDDDLLAELRRQPLGDETRGQIDVAARGEAVNDGDGALGRRLGERGRDLNADNPAMAARRVIVLVMMSVPVQFGALATW